MTDKIVCPNCGAENIEGAEFCEVCHTELESGPPTPIEESGSSEQSAYDLIPAAEDDLPGLLHALKHEDDNLPSEDSTEEDKLSSGDSENLFEQGDEGEDIPDWLHRIRQRASEEEDSVGEITQKITAAKESLSVEKRSTQRENFESWIHRLRGPIGGSAVDEQENSDTAEEIAEEQENIQEKEPDWLRKIRKAEGKTSEVEAPESSDDKNGLLNWLVGLEEEHEETFDENEAKREEDRDEAESLEDEKIEDSGTTKEIVVDEESLFKVIPPKLKVTNDEKKQAERLSSMILDESAPRPVRKLKRRSSLGAARFFFALLLIGSLSLSLFIGQGADYLNETYQPHTMGLLTWARSLEENESVLVVLDYQPAFSGEIGRIAAPVLKLLNTQNGNFSVVYSSFAGSFLLSRLLDNISGFDMESVQDLGYIPVGAFGAFDLGVNLDTGLVITGLPEIAKRFPEDDFDGILILSDTYSGSKAWIEQLTIFLPQTPVHLIVADQAVPMLLPFFESGQISGLVSGLNDAAVLEAELSQSAIDVRQRRAYQVGLVLLVVVMIGGAIYSATQNQEERGDA